MKRLLLLPVLLLPACAQEPSDAAQVLQEVMATHQASLAAIPGAPSPTPTSNPAPAAPLAEAVPQPALTAATAALPRPEQPRLRGIGNVATAGQLLGQTPEEVVQQLGEPRLRRAEGTAEVWHYQATQCHLDVILYPEEGSRRGLRVGFAAARAVGTARREEAACLRDIARDAGPVIPRGGDALGLGA